MRFFLLIGLLVISNMLAAPVVAQQFRIETEVFRGSSVDPISENLTLFSDNMILDFMLPTDRSRFPDEIVIYLCREKKFVLLDTGRKVKTTVLDGEVLKVIAALQSSNIGESKNDFIFHPEFQESYDANTGQLTLESEQLTYRAKGKRPDEDNVLHRYYEFISQFARLNATDPRRMPPFPRLKLNAALKKYGFIPSEVQLTLIPSLEPPSDPIELRTTHNVIWQLSEKDQKRIDSAKRYWMEFDEVPLAQFRNLQHPTSAKESSGSR